MAGTTPAQPLRALEALGGHYGSGPGVAMTPIPARAHVSLRSRPETVSALGQALGIALPLRPKTSAEADGLAALWLGPEDWLLVGADAASRSATDLIAAVEGSGIAAHSAVDVSNRYVGITVDGPAAQAVLSAGCPQDLRLRTFPVGAVSRSVMSKADVVIWRRGETRFEVLCVRSFADYVWAFLVEAARAPAV
ncbi:MAG: sarcosine oxidase subunit gamma [Rhizobiaceae bacterium]|nr:sarcosine oxidase subunit gamma [Rhizobiaceae bacterium]